MRRGEVRTVAGGAGYAGKPRPAVIVQDDRFADLGSVTICPLTSDDTEAHLFRPSVEPAAANGLRRPSRLMVDKIVTVPKSKVGENIGMLDNAEIVRLDRAMLVFLGLAGATRKSE